jgi:hypothetical protein
MILDEALIEALWRQAEPNVFIDREQFAAGLQQYDQVLVTPAFVFLAKGPEFHFLSLGTKQPMSLKFIRETLSAFIKQHGYACTRTPVEDKRQQRFNEKLGFYKTHEDEHDIFYRIDEVKPCP